MKDFLILVAMAAFFTGMFILIFAMQLFFMEAGL